MASGSEHDDEAPSLASRVLDVLDDDLLNIAEALPETPVVQDVPEEEPVAVEEASDSRGFEALPAVAPTEVPSPAKAEDEGEEEQGIGASEEGAPEEEVVAPPPAEGRRGRKFKPKGMYLGRRRDTDEPVDIKPTVLARHAAMLGSTGSGKTVMAKALIEEAALAGIPALIIDPQGDLARLALGGDASTVEAKGEDAARMRRLLDSTEVRIWTPLRSKGLPLCIDPFHAPPADLDPEEAITAWDMVAAGFTSLAGYDVEKAQGKTIKPYLYEVLVQGTRVGLDVTDF